MIGKAKNVNGTMAQQLIILMGHFHNERAIYLFIEAILKKKKLSMTNLEQNNF